MKHLVMVALSLGLIFVAVAIIKPVWEVHSIRKQSIKRTLWQNQGTDVPSDFLYAAMSSDENLIDRLILVTETELQELNADFVVYLVDGSETTMPRDVFVYDPRRVSGLQNQLRNYNEILQFWERDTTITRAELAFNDASELVELYLYHNTGDGELFTYKIDDSGSVIPEAWYWIRN